MARILVVEDEPDIAMLLADDLRVEGYQVEVVGDGEAAAGRGARSRLGPDPARRDAARQGRLRCLPRAAPGAASARRS